MPRLVNWLSLVSIGCLWSQPLPYTSPKKYASNCFWCPTDWNKSTFLFDTSLGTDFVCFHMKWLKADITERFKATEMCKMTTKNRQNKSNWCKKNANFPMFCLVYVVFCIVYHYCDCIWRACYYEKSQCQYVIQCMTRRNMSVPLSSSQIACLWTLWMSFNPFQIDFFYVITTKRKFIQTWNSIKNF